MSRIEASRRIPIQSIKAKDEDGTKRLKLLMHLGEVERQSAIFGACFENAMSVSEDAADGTDAWRHIQGAMFAAIVVNRLVTAEGNPRPWLGGSRKEARDAATWRASELRRILGLPEDESVTPIFNVRGFRNGMEHIDQRLDWALNSPTLLSLSDFYLSDGSLLRWRVRNRPIRQQVCAPSIPKEGLDCWVATHWTSSCSNEAPPRTVEFSG
jgi:hypothetical protein